MIHKRQAEDIARATEKSGYSLHKRTVDQGGIKRFFDDCLTKAATAKQLRFSQMGMYRSLQCYLLKKLIIDTSKPLLN